MVKIIAMFLLSKSSVEKENRARVQPKDWHSNCWQMLRFNQTWIKHISSFLHTKPWTNLALLCCLLTLRVWKISCTLIGLLLKLLIQPFKKNWFFTSTKKVWGISKTFWRTAWETSSRQRTSTWQWLMPWLLLLTSKLQLTRNEMSVDSQESKSIRN
jgi:hypothetical protein